MLLKFALEVQSSGSKLLELRRRMKRKVMTIRPIGNKLAMCCALSAIIVQQSSFFGVHTNKITVASQT